jgi:ATP-binding cassette subfamily B protein
MNIKVKQRDITDCGAACLASVARHYRLDVPVSRIRQFAGTDKDGTNVAGMIEAAKKLGLDARGVKGPFESLAKIPLPAIAHVVVRNVLHHYIVIYKVGKNKILVMDPADGEMHAMSNDNFKNEWTGVLLLLMPSDDFIPGNRETSLSERLLSLLKPHSGRLFTPYLDFQPRFLCRRSSILCLSMETETCLT